jgi:hypothetical protein
MSHVVTCSGGRLVRLGVEKRRQFPMPAVPRMPDAVTLSSAASVRLGEEVNDIDRNAQPVVSNKGLHVVVVAVGGRVL